MTSQNVKEKMVYFNFKEIKTYINHEGLEKKRMKMIMVIVYYLKAGKI